MGGRLWSRATGGSPGLAPANGTAVHRLSNNDEAWAAAAAPGCKKRQECGCSPLSFVAEEITCPISCLEERGSLWLNLATAAQQVRRRLLYQVTFSCRTLYSAVHTE